MQGGVEFATCAESWDSTGDLSLSRGAIVNATEVDGSPAGPGNVFRSNPASKMSVPLLNCGVSPDMCAAILFSLFTLTSGELAFNDHALEVVKYACKGLCAPARMLGCLSLLADGSDPSTHVSLKTLAYALHHDVNQPASFALDLNKKTAKCVICAARTGVFIHAGHKITQHPVHPEIQVWWACDHTSSVYVGSVPDGRVVLTHHAMSYGHDHIHLIPSHVTGAFDALAVDELNRTIISFQTAAYAPTVRSVFSPADYYSPLDVFYGKCSDIGKGALVARASLYVTGRVKHINVWKTTKRVDPWLVAEFVAGQLSGSSHIIKKIIAVLLSGYMPISGWIATMPDVCEVRCARTTLGLQKFEACNYYYTK
jgi:hypothetical protein